MTDYYVTGSDPADGSDLDSSVIRAEWAALAAGFAKIAGYTGAANRVPHINSGATSMTSTSGFTFDGTTFTAPALAVTNAATFNGAVTLGNAAADNITVTGTVTSNLIFTDATYDIGASGATRPRDLFLSRNAVIGSALTYGGVTLTAAVTGTGKMVLDTSPTLVTPLLGTPTSGTLTNCTGLPLTTGITGTLGAANGGTGVANNAASTITITGAYSLGLTLSNTTALTLPTTGTIATLAGTEEFDNKTLDSSVGKGTWTASGTWTLPAVTLGGAVTVPTGVTVTGAGTAAITGFTSVSATTGTFTNIGGTLSTAAQPNITTLGTVAGIGLSGGSLLALGVDNNATLATSSTSGLISVGKGSTNDFNLLNSALASVIRNPTGTQNVVIAGALTAGAISGTSFVAGGTSLTAFADATTLLTLGGTGATSVVAIPGTKASTSSTTGSVTFAGGIGVAGNSFFGGTLGVTGGFGCNTKAAQTAYASGGALNAYGAGANGFDSGANASALHAMVVSIRAALVANGIMS